MLKLYILTLLLVFVFFINTKTTSAVDPETGMTVPEIITYHGYPAEEHFVTTNDGYILGLHRIPHGKNMKSSENRQVIFLQHGLLCSSADWVVNPVNESLAFMLADAGFDVWLGNSRGNTYSRSHKTLKVDSDAFWKFSWDSMASEDLPAVIEYIVSETGQQQLHYAGHSQGTMIAFAGFSQNKVLSKRIKKFYALAPVAYLGHMESPLKYLASFIPEIEWLFKILGVRDFLPQSPLITWLASHMCTKSVLKSVCANIVFVICGYDKPQMNETRLDVYMTHSPAGTSVHNMVHYAQAYKTGNFQMYDWGEKENLERYNQSTPPLYDLSNFHVPTVLYYGGHDWLADIKDVNVLLKKLPSGVVKLQKLIGSWMHLDFIWGMDAPREVYKSLIADALEDNKNY